MMPNEDHSNENDPQVDPAEQARLAFTIMNEHGLALATLEKEAVELYFNYFPNVQKEHYQADWERRGHVAKRWLRAELIKRHGELDNDDHRAVNAACAYGTMLLLEAYDRLADRQERPEVRATRQRLITCAKAKINADLRRGFLAEVIDTYFATLLVIGRLDHFEVDAAGRLWRRELKRATSVVAKRVLYASNHKSKQAIINQGLRIAEVATATAIKELAVGRTAEK